MLAELVGIENAPIAEGAGIACPSIATNTRRNTRLDTVRGTVFPYRKCNQVQGWLDPCQPDYDPDAHKCTAACWGVANFQPFTIYDLEGTFCPVPAYDLQEWADEAVIDGTNWALSTELQSAPWSGNPSLQSSAVDLTGSGALHPTDAIAVLMRAMRMTGHGKGVLHVPNETLPAFDDLLRYNGAVLRGPGNLPVNPGPGLTGIGPDSTGNIDIDGEPYIYITSQQVEWNVSGIEQYGPGSGEMRHNRTNSTWAEALRRGILRFNPSCVFAVRVCIKNISCCDGSGGPAVVIDPPPEPEPAPRLEPVNANEAERISESAAALLAQREAASVKAAKAVEERDAEVAAEAAKREAEAVQRFAEADAVQAADAQVAKLQAELEADIVERFADPSDSLPEDVTVAEVLEFVGGDADRAKEAFDAELDGKNRVTLIEALDEILEQA